MQGLVCFDLDGTLLRGPTVCEVLAESLGRLAEMQQFETLTSEPEIVLARIEIERWYRESGVPDLAERCKGAQLAPGAEEAVAQLQSNGIEVAIASITSEFAVAWFAKRLNVRHYLGTGLSASGEINHVWGRSKGQWLSRLTSDLAVPKARVASVGDSAGDADLLRAATLRFFVGRQLPNDVAEVIHMPDADVRDIAHRILAAWSETPRAGRS